jgi:hypothetical protein
MTFWEFLEASPVGDFIASSSWAFPTLECVHVLAITTVVGTIAIMDLRLLGVTSFRYGVLDTSKDTLRWTWGAFGLALITGVLLFVSKASTYVRVPWFQWKMVFMALAGVNMAVFHLSAWKSVDQWDTAPVIPRAAKIAGGLSLGLWVLVVFVARVVGFVLGKYNS